MDDHSDAQKAMLQTLFARDKEFKAYYELSFISERIAEGHRGRSEQEGRGGQGGGQGGGRGGRGGQGGGRGGRGGGRGGRGGGQGGGRGGRGGQDYDSGQLPTSSVPLQHFVKGPITTNQQKKEHRKARQAEKEELQPAVKDPQLASTETIDDWDEVGAEASDQLMGEYLEERDTEMGEDQRTGGR